MIGQHFGRVQSNFLKTVLIIFLASGSSLAVSMMGVGKESIIMVFLLGVLFTSVFTGSYSWGVLTSFASLMLFNFLFTEPRYTFVIYSNNDIVLLLFFLVTAVVSGFVTSQLQQQIVLTAKNERTANILYQIASGFLSVSGRKNIVMQAIGFIQEFTDRKSIVMLNNDDTVYSDGEHDFTRLPKEYKIQSPAESLGLMQVDAQDIPPDEQADLIIQAVVMQLGIALDRENLYREQEKIRLAMEKEHLRATLLRAVSHDLRSPLTALSGAGNLLSDNFENLTDTERKKLAKDISEEITWLIDLVENILNMTRINESQLVLKKEEEVIDDVVSEATAHVERLLKGRKFKVELPEEVVMVPMDGRLIVRVLINLLENAVRHTPMDAEISLTVVVAESKLKVTVADTGSGIDQKISGSLFEKYVTLDKGHSDSKRGIGLGLTICKAIIEAHGGSISAEPNSPKGVKFIFTLPLEG
jgi:two-component system, OmpR family, sensor histidine kinase KdpD